MHIFSTPNPDYQMVNMSLNMNSVFFSWYNNNLKQC